MGSIESYETEAGKRYRVRYRKPDHSQVSKRGFKTKKSAELHLASVEVSKHTGSFIDPSRSRILTSVWLKEWMEGRMDFTPTTTERVQGIIDNHINPALGAYPIGSLDHETIQSWAAGLSKTQGAWSVRKIVNVLSGALQKSVRSGRLPHNPARGLDLPEISKSSKRYLTHEQVRDLAETVDTLGRGGYGGRANGYGLAIYVLAYCGLRWSELSGLRVRDIDFKRGRLEVQHTVTEVNGIQNEGVPKDYESRSIPVPPTVLRGLWTHVDGEEAGSPVFMSPRTRGWLRNRAFRRGWFDEAARIIGEAGLTPHELRHTAASLAVSAGANVKAVQRMLGHASAAVTLDVYADLFDSDLDEVSAALDEEIMKTNVSKPRPAEETEVA